ncbi:MAG: UDP-N-acetylglucosamine 2-epimerase [Desulfobacterales bacterium]|nr:UDP-N-acetylglucosamine 2-epimerase [Desulfobacterales bacterium]
MIHIVIGTKAQLIKMAPIMCKLHENNIYYNFIFTSQHLETIDSMLHKFRIKKPDYIMYKGHQDVTSLFQMLRWLISCLYETIQNLSIIFQNDKNGIVLVHGDTFSTLIGAIIGKIAGLQVGHIESGLRSFNIFHPFPEELTRLMVFRLSDYYFCPGNWALNNLMKYRNKKKINIGANTLYDTLNMVMQEKFEINLPLKPFGIVSIHRYENIFNKHSLLKCIDIIEKISEHYFLLFILHLPTQKQLLRYGMYHRLKNNPNIELRQRYNYADFMYLLTNSDFLVTDGGSNQEECSYLGTPCLLLRKATERIEGLKKNTVISEYNMPLINDFFDNLSKFKTEPINLIHSPSEKIIEICKDFA